MNGETLFAIWAAGPRGQRHRRHGHKSSTVSQESLTVKGFLKTI